MMSPAQQAFLDWWFDEDQDTETDVVFFNRMMHADPVLAAEINRRAAQETAAVREFTTKLPKMGMSTVCDLCGETFGNHIAQHPDGRTSACPTVNRGV
jgi:hypothetical protein